MFIIRILKRVWSDITGLFKGIDIGSIELQEAIGEKECSWIFREEEFRVYSSIDEYNRSLMKVFLANKNTFCLDQAHIDGHFRV